MHNCAGDTDGVSIGKQWVSSCGSLWKTKMLTLIPSPIPANADKHREFLFFFFAKATQFPMTKSKEKGEKSTTSRRCSVGSVFPCLFSPDWATQTQGTGTLAFPCLFAEFTVSVGSNWEFRASGKQTSKSTEVPLTEGTTGCGGSAAAAALRLVFYVWRPAEPSATFRHLWPLPHTSPCTSCTLSPRKINQDHVYLYIVSCPPFD